MAEVIAKRGDITKLTVDAIVNPANSSGTMGGGVALAIKKAGGDRIEEEAVRKSPVPIGEAVATAAGKLNAKFVIHAPTMEKSAELITTKNVLLATTAALNCAKNLKVKSIAFPGMGTGVGGVPKKQAAIAMVSEINKFVKKNPDAFDAVFLIGYDNSLYTEFENALRTKARR